MINWDDRLKSTWNDGPAFIDAFGSDDAPPVARRHLCNGGGKSGGTTYQQSTVQIPPEVLARYNAVNARAEQVAQQPFVPYTGQMVAPINATQQSAINALDAYGMNAFRPYFADAQTYLWNARDSALPYYSGATTTLQGGFDQGQQYAGLANSALGTGYSAANAYYDQASGNITGAQSASSPYNTQAMSALQGAASAAAPYQSSAGSLYGSVLGNTSGYNTNATNLVNSALSGASPYNTLASQNIQSALAAGQPYLDDARDYTLQGANAVNPLEFNAGQIEKYMSPYLSNVVDATMANLRQQQQQEQSSLMGSQMARGAFGGDRAGIGAANLAKQQNMASGLTVANLLNQGYGQALGAFQQQQGVQLSADQANRAALQQTGQTLAALGQQGYSQQMGAAQANALLGNQIYSQGLGAGQAIAGIGNQIYNQQMGVGNAQAALGAQLYGQGANTAAQTAAIGNQIYNQGMGAAALQGQLGQQQFNQYLQGAQLQGALGNQLFNQGLATSQQQAALGNQLYGMNLASSQQSAALGNAHQANFLNGANAVLGAGTLQQQTQQAQDTAAYNQFLQQQGYDFQTAQFLANIAMGTGALSGSSTNSVTTQPGAYFSDERLKENMKEIGKTKDGLPIYSYNFPGQATQIGLSAQDVEKKYPEAVGEADGYKTVDYSLATRRAAKARGGLVPEGYAIGGMPGDIGDILAMQQAMYGTPYGGAAAQRVPISPMQPRSLVTAKLPDVRSPAPQQSALGAGASALNDVVGTGRNAAALYGAGKDLLVGTKGTKDDPTGTGGLLGRGGKWNPSEGWLGSGNATPPPTGGLGSVKTEVLPPVADATSSAADAASSVSQADMFGDALEKFLPDSAFASRGGRQGMALGGLPYGGVDYIPEELTKPEDPDELQRKKKGLEPDLPSVPGQKSGAGGGSGLGKSIGSAAGAIAGSFIPIPGGTVIGSALGGLFGGLFNEGGRVGYETGGAPEDEAVLLAQRQLGLNDNAPTSDFFNSKILTQESGKRHFTDDGSIITSSKGARGIAQVMPATAPEAAKLAGVEWNPELFNRGRTGDPKLDQEALDYNRKLGEAYFQEQLRTFKDPMVAAAAYNAGPAAVQTAQQKAATQGGTYLDYLPKETQGYVAALGGPSPTAAPLPVPSGLAPPPQAAPAAPADRNFFDRAGDWLDRNERPIVSLLTGLGAMAASPSRYLGSAILEGLGAGAAQYANLGMKGRQLDISKQQADTATQRVGIEETAKNIQVLAILRQMAATYTARGLRVPEQIEAQIAALTGKVAGAAAAPTLASTVAPAQQGIPAPSNNAPVATAPLPAPAPAAPPVAEPPKTAPVTVTVDPMEAAKAPSFRSRLNPDSDPFVLQQRAREVAPYDKAESDRLAAQAQTILDRWNSTGMANDKDGNIIEVPGWKEWKANQERIKPNQQWIAEQADAAIARSQSREQLNAIKDVLETYQSGALAEAKAKAAALGRALGIDVPDSATANPAAFQTFLKSAYNNVFANMRSAGTGTDAKMEGLLASTPNPEMQPAANKKILAQMYAMMDYQDRLYNDLTKALETKPDLNREVFINDWRKRPENQLDTIVKNVAKDLAVRGATPKNRADLELGHTYVLEPQDGARFGVKINKPTKYRVVEQDGVRGLQRVE